jgi:hypothetical protein
MYYGPQCVRNGLVLALDSADKNSYAGSGTTWRDLSGNDYTTTLTNTPTFSNTNQGILTFARASSQYAETAASFPSLSNWTIESWVKFTTVPSANTTVSAIITNVYNGSNINFCFTTDVDGTANKGMYVAFFNGAWRFAPFHAPSAGVWYHYVGTYDAATIRMYVNGSSYSSTSYAGVSSSGGTVRIARRWDADTSVGNFINGAIPTVKIYNRALTAAEVLQNYNATKNRFDS